MKYLKLFNIIVIVSWNFFPSNAYAQYQIKPFTEYELRSLPPLIQIKLRSHLGDKRPQIKRAVDKYIKEFGWGYNGLHHYGKGLIYLQRVYSGEKDNYIRKLLLKYAVDEFTFIIAPHKMKKWGNERFNSYFAYEIYSKRGEALLLQNEIGKAAIDFQHAIKIKPSYFHAYLMLSECYMRLGDNENAKKILELGRARAAKKK